MEEVNRLTIKIYITPRLYFEMARITAYIKLEVVILFILQLINKIRYIWYYNNTIKN